MRLTLGRQPSGPELTEAEPAGRAAGLRMADVTFKEDKAVRNVPQMIVFIHLDDAAPADLFEAVGLS